jgi:hypothetical protein
MISPIPFGDCLPPEWRPGAEGSKFHNQHAAPTQFKRSEGLKKCQLLSKLNTSYGFYLLLAHSVDAMENAVTHSLQVAQRSLAVFEGMYYHIGCKELELVQGPKLD